MSATSPPADSTLTQRLANRAAVLRSEIDSLIASSQRAHVYDRSGSREHQLLEESENVRGVAELAAEVATLSRRVDLALRLLGLILGEHSDILPAEKLGPLLEQIDGLTT